ncbi:MAG: lysylphosphatidylglycerol synthase transmembrane domain-containing protein [Candidatus Paceibacterota bacterium]
MGFGKRNIFLVLLSFLFGIIIFLWLGKTTGWDKIIQAFQVFRGWQGIVIIALSFLIAIIGNWRWFEILKDNEINIPFWRLFRSYLGGYAMMYLFPIIFLSGEIFRSIVISKEDRVPMAKAASSVIIERILEWTINLLVIFFGLFFFTFKFGILPLEILYIFGIALAGFAIIISYFYFKALRQKSIVAGFIKKFSRTKEITQGNSIVETENEIFKFFKLKSRSMYKGLFLSLLKAGAMLARAWLLIFFLTNINIGFPASLSVLGSTYFSTLIPIPTSLGSQEVIQAAAFLSLDFEVSVAAAFTMIIRAGEILVSLLGLAFLAKKGFNIMEERFNNKINNG